MTWGQRSSPHHSSSDVRTCNGRVSQKLTASSAPLTWISKPTDVATTEGSGVRVECRVSGNAVLVLWQRMRGMFAPPVEPESRVTCSLVPDSQWVPVRDVTTAEDTSLRLEKTEKSDAGTYRCQVSDDSESVLSAEFRLHVSGI